MRSRVFQYILYVFQNARAGRSTRTTGAHASLIHLRAKFYVARCPFNGERLSGNPSTVDLRCLAAWADLYGGLGNIANGFPGYAQLCANRFYC
jgi:hypothetical protein